MPDGAQIDSFACEGFQDLLITAELTFPREDALALIAALDTTFETDQNHTFLHDDRKQRQPITQPEFEGILYHLPGVGSLFVRNVEVQVPKDNAAEARLIFEGWQF